MSVDADKQLYRRWLLELWNGDLTVADQVVTRASSGPGRGGQAWSMDHRSWSIPSG